MTRIRPAPSFSGPIVSARHRHPSVSIGWRLAVGLLVLALQFPGRPEPAQAARSSSLASDLIAAVNQLRASYGLSPYIVDPILMAVADRQNDYSISIGQITHYGPDGSRPREQAIDAGYGGGATVFISENIAMGTGLTPAEAVDMWTGDDPHLNTMIGTYYRDVGAGAGESDGSYYYTLIAGYVAGGTSAHSTAPAGDLSWPVGPAPVLRSTAQADGSIVHVVESGQTLWTIAAVYDVDLSDLLKLNGLAGTAVLHPGDQIIIRRGSPATPTAGEATATGGTKSAPPTRAVTRTARVTATPIPMPAPPRNPTSVALIVGGAALLVLGLVLGVRNQPSAISRPPSAKTTRNADG